MAAETDLDARERLVNALANGANVSDAARASGYSRKHVHGLLKDAEFCALVDERKRGRADKGERERLAGVGLRVLEEVATDKEAPHAARVAAARALVALDASRAKPAATGQAPQETTAPAGEALTPEQAQERIRMLA